MFRSWLVLVICVASAFTLGFVSSRLVPPPVSAEKVYEIKVSYDPDLITQAQAVWGAESTDPVWVFTFRDRIAAIVACDEALTILSRKTDKALGIIP